MKSFRLGKTTILIAIFVMLFSSYGCSKKDNFNIVGNWRIHLETTDGTDDYLWSFQGDENLGDVYENGVDVGNYTVADKNVSIIIQFYVNIQLGYFYLPLNGSAIDDNNMSGSFTAHFTNNPLNTVSGNWTGTRQ
ncbi:MAG: hypothetical protein MUO31_14150 [Thermodesulfovibrionales bacterium]|nr:hypothetical protein [Thermodesulfovibrionales bacterium]